MGTSAASEPLNFFIIVIYDGRIEHFTDFLNNLLNRYYTY